MSAPAWARGYDVDDLRATADIFRRHDKGLTLGAFTRVDEARVAAWHDAGEVEVWGDYFAAIAWRHVRKREALLDFAGEVAGICQPGDRVVWRFAGPPEEAATMLLVLAEEAKGLVWASAWQESPADMATMISVGWAWQGTKVRSSSELVGIYASDGSPARLRPRDWPALARLSLPRLDVAPLARRLFAAPPAWEDHYSSYNLRNSWSAVALRGYGASPGFIEKPVEMSKKWKAANAEKLAWKLGDTAARAWYQEAEPLIAAIPGEKHRIRLMRLEPGGGELARHADITDPDAGTRDGKLMRIHIPVVTNDGVRFEGWQLDGSRAAANMAPGEAWYLDTRKPHTARNDGVGERVHLVMDVEASSALWELLGVSSQAERLF